jgi:hypothetical protein
MKAGNWFSSIQTVQGLQKIDLTYYTGTPKKMSGNFCLPNLKK